MKKYLILLALPLLAFRCSDSGKSVTSTNDVQIQQTTQSEKKVQNTVTVNAEVYHSVAMNDGSGMYEIKDANRKEQIRINIYDDGTMFMVGGDMIGGQVRYTRIPGYEYEANNSHSIYAFNL